MAILPIHTIPLLIHVLHKIGATDSIFATPQYCQRNILHIAFHLSLLSLFEHLVGILAERCRFFSIMSVKGFSLFSDAQPMLHTQPIGIIFHRLQLRLALLELMSVCKTHAVYYKMCVYMLLIFMGGNQHLEVFPLRA